MNFSGGAGGGHLVFSRSANLTYRGNISGDLDLTQRGTDTVLLSGDNTYTGGTIVSSGTLVINTSTALPGGRSLTVARAARSSSIPPLSIPRWRRGDAPAAGFTCGGAAAVPEPGTLALLAVAVCGGAIAGRIRSRRKKL